MVRMPDGRLMVRRTGASNARVGVGRGRGGGMIMMWMMTRAAASGDSFLARRRCDATMGVMGWRRDGWN